MQPSFLPQIGVSRLSLSTGASDNPKKFDGMFDGVPGQYACTTAADCSATANAKGELTAC